MDSEILTRLAKRVMQCVAACTLLLCMTIGGSAAVKYHSEQTADRMRMDEVKELIDTKFKKLSKDIDDLRAQVMAAKTVIETKDEKKK